MQAQPTGKRVGRAPEAANSVAMRDTAEPTLPIGIGAIGKVGGRGNRKTKESESQDIGWNCPSARYVV
jgi:hypothetical protein